MPDWSHRQVVVDPARAFSPVRFSERRPSGRLSSLRHVRLMGSAGSHRPCTSAARSPPSRSPRSLGAHRGGRGAAVPAVPGRRQACRGAGRGRRCGHGRRPRAAPAPRRRSSRLTPGRNSRRRVADSAGVRMKSLHAQPAKRRGAVAVGERDRVRVDRAVLTRRDPELAVELETRQLRPTEVQWHEPVAVVIEVDGERDQRLAPIALVVAADDLDRAVEVDVGGPRK